MRACQCAHPLILKRRSSVLRDRSASFLPPGFVFSHNWLVVGGGTDARGTGSSHDAAGWAPPYSFCRPRRRVQPMTSEYISLKVTLRMSQRQSGHIERAGCVPAFLPCANKIELGKGERELFV